MKSTFKKEGQEILWTRNPMDKVFKIEDLRPIRDEMTISRNSRLSDKTPIT